MYRLFRNISEKSLDKRRKDFDYKLNKVNRLHRNINKKSLKASTQFVKYHIYKLRTRHFREYLFAKKERTTPLIKKLISIIVLLNIDIDLLHETNTYVSKNADGKVKYSFSNLHQNLSAKFSDNKNVNYGSFHLPMETMDKKVGNRETEYQFYRDREREGDDWYNI